MIQNGVDRRLSFSSLSSASDVPVQGNARTAKNDVDAIEDPRHSLPEAMRNRGTLSYCVGDSPYLQEEGGNRFSHVGIPRPSLSAMGWTSPGSHQKVLDENERLQADNASLRAELDLLRSQLAAVKDALPSHLASVISSCIENESEVPGPREEDKTAPTASATAPAAGIDGKTTQPGAVPENKGEQETEKPGESSESGKREASLFPPDVVVSAPDGALCPEAPRRSRATRGSMCIEFVENGEGSDGLQLKARPSQAGRRSTRFFTPMCSPGCSEETEPESEPECDDHNTDMASEQSACQVADLSPTHYKEAFIPQIDIAAVIASQKKNEAKGVTSKSFLSKHNVTCEERAAMAGWLYKNLMAENAIDETIFHSVLLLDRYLHMKDPSTGAVDLQVVGMACMLLATKYEEVIPISVSCIVKHQPGKRKPRVTKADVLAAELEVLKVIEFNQTYPTPYLFLQYYLSECKEERLIRSMAYYLCTLLILSPTASCIKASERAAAMLYLAMRYVGGRSWGPEHQRITGCKAKDLTSTCKVVQRELLLTATEPRSSPHGFIKCIFSMEDPHGKIAKMDGLNQPKVK